MRPLIRIFLIIILTSCELSPNEEKQTLSSKDIHDSTETILGERIHGPANVRDTVNGNVLFALNDDVLVETSLLHENWYEIGLFVSLNKKQSEEFLILPNCKLFSEDGEVIGSTLDSLVVWMVNENYGFIGGYTYKDNIKKNTIPEVVLAKNILEGNLSLNSLDSFLTSFSFELYDNNEELEYKQFFIYESIVIDPSPRDRITLLFNNKNDLVAVIHSRPLNLKQYKTFNLVRGHSLTVLGDIQEEEIKRLIKKRNNFYNSID